MPVVLVPLAVTDDNGVPQKFHTDVSSTEGCNLDDARQAGHLKPTTWESLIQFICDGVNIRELLCENCFPVPAALNLMARSR